VHKLDRKKGPEETLTDNYETLIRVVLIVLTRRSFIIRIPSFIAALLFLAFACPSSFKSVFYTAGMSSKPAFSSPRSRPVVSEAKAAK